MVRLHFVVEGKTEKEFVDDVLSPFLAGCGIYADATMVVTSRRRGKVYKGGGKYHQIKRDLVNRMKEDDKPDSYFTTMFDLYALPTDFPDYETIKPIADPYERISRFETAFGSDIDHVRFVPYVQLHEFEALLFADPVRILDEFPDKDQEVRQLQTVGREFGNPELIDDGADTAPSKRIIKEIPAYEGRKASAGPSIASLIGIETLRRSCQHFNGWVDRLCALGGERFP
ncbi:MAG: DUF4276 family protein [Alphaproteobacteria bacterium]|jgi:hypothetical protein|nr:DUF4276 family protein [Alphaproteobacteria bacterium]